MHGRELTIVDTVGADPAGCATKKEAKECEEKRLEFLQEHQPLTMIHDD